VLGSAGLLAKRLDALDDEPGFRPQAEELRQPRLDAAVVVARRLQIALATLVGVREQELRVVAQRGEELLQRAAEADLPLDGFHLGLNSRDLRQAKLVDLVRRHRRRRARSQALDVIGRAVGQLPDAGRDLVAVGAIGFGKSDELSVRRADPVGQGSGRRGP